MSSVRVFPGVMELELQESLKLKRQRPRGGSGGLRALGVEETRQAGVSDWDAESGVVYTPMLGRGAFSNYDSYPITPFEPTNLSID